MRLLEEKYYHIYHRGVNKENIYYHPADYKKFIDRYIYYLFLATDTLAYCMIPNHFHLLVRIRSKEEQVHLYNRCKTKYPTGTFHGDNYHDYKYHKASSQIGHLLNSYTRYFNTNHDREGILFDGRFKRIEIDSDSYLSYLICYIHRNPVHHRISDDYESYPYSSYHELTNDEKSFLNRKEVFSYLGGRDNYFMAHQEVLMQIDEKYFLEI
jgi:putative transposase